MNTQANMAARYEHEIPEGYEARIEGNKVIIERKESEDERIRKHIIEILNLLSPCHWDGNEKSKCIAYLEKQKEQKVDIDKLRKDIYQSGYNDCYQHGKVDAQKEQKPSEWSEKDKKIMNEIITIMDGGKVTSGTYLSEYAAWLKSLRPQKLDVQNSIIMTPLMSLTK